MTAVRHTAFHARTAEHNHANAWVQRGGFTVPAHYADCAQEALAARVSAVMVDISAREELRFSGEGAVDLLATAFRTDMDALLIGRSEPVFWCADGGGVRGMGTVSRLGANDFLLNGVDADMGWFSGAASRFRAGVRDATAERGLLLIAGPYASSVLAAADLEEASRLAPSEHAIYDWRQLGAIVFRGPDGSYRVSCARDDAILAFDRLFQAGRMLGCRLAGQEALELLELEAGRVVPFFDFTPARDAAAQEPSPASLGLKQARLLATPAKHRVLAGIALDSNDPAPFSTVFCNQVEQGHTLRSLYSPALRRAIALAVLAPACDVGSSIVIRRTALHGATDIKGRVVELPFL